MGWWAGTQPAGCGAVENVQPSVDRRCVCAPHLSGAPAVCSQERFEEKFEERVSGPIKKYRMDLDMINSKVTQRGSMRCANGRPAQPAAALPLCVGWSHSNDLTAPAALARLDFDAAKAALAKIQKKGSGGQKLQKAERTCEQTGMMYNMVRDPTTWTTL